MKIKLLMIAGILSVFAAPVFAASYEIKPEPFGAEFKTVKPYHCDIRCQIAELELYLQEIQSEVDYLRLQMLKQDLAEIEGDQADQPIKPKPRPQYK